MQAPLRVGKYRLLARLGSGGMADVYLAVDDGPSGLGFTKLAVVKKVRPHLAEDPEFNAMLLDEASISARLNHPNVVHVFDVGVDEGAPFMAMEYLDGQPVGRIIRRAAKVGERIPVDAGCVIVSDLLRALDHAHDLADFDGRSLDVVHRDVSPQNVFVSYEGQIKLVDFGIAKAACRSNETRQGIVKGKIRYMSPEQARGDVIDRRTDIFAAGVILWQLATNCRFWDGVEDEAVLRALIAGAYEPSPRAVKPDVSEAIDRICRRALAWRAADRYQTAGAMLADLEELLGEREVAARRAMVAMLARLFGADRSSRREVVEGLATSWTVATSLSATILKSGGTASSEGGTPSLPLVGDSGVPAALGDVAPTRILEVAPKPRVRRGWIGPASVAVALAIALVGVGSTRMAPSIASRINGAAPVQRASSTPVSDVLPLASESDEVVLAARVPRMRAPTPPTPQKAAPTKRRAVSHARPKPKATTEGGAGAAPTPDLKLDSADPWH